MKSLWILIGLNVGVCALTLLLTAIDSDRNAYPKFDNGVARVVIQDKFSDIPSLASASSVRLNRSCVERNDRRATVVGSGDADDRLRVIEGVPVNDRAKFTYTASISSKCEAYNPNCYQVDKLVVDGSRTIEPRY